MTKKKKITVIPSGGLGNRMRVLSCCIQIAEKEDRELWIAWPNRVELGCDISDIFKSIGFDYKTPPKWLYFLLVQIYRHGGINRFPAIYKLFSNIFFNSYVFDDDADIDQAKIDVNDQSILVATCFAFKNAPNFKQFRFVDHLNEETEKEYKKIGEPYIGIHIRRTDHVALMKHSPFENYLIAIDKCIEANSNQKFFLASDDIKTKELLTNKYGNRIYTSNYKLGRGDLEGIYGAVVELLLLSKSSKIICSVISSYSDTAILIGDIKEVINV